MVILFVVSEANQASRSVLDQRDLLSPTWKLGSEVSISEVSTARTGRVMASMIHCSPLLHVSWLDRKGGATATVARSGERLTFAKPDAGSVSARPRALVCLLGSAPGLTLGRDLSEMTIYARPTTPAPTRTIRPARYLTKPTTKSTLHNLETNPSTDRVRARVLAVVHKIALL